MSFKSRQYLAVWASLLACILVVAVCVLILSLLLGNAYSPANRLILITTLGLAVIAALLLSAKIFMDAATLRNSARADRELLEMAEAFGRGDFSYRISGGGRDISGHLAGRFNLAAEKVAEVTGRLNSGISELLSNAGNLADSASSLRQGAGDQTQQTTQAVTAMDEISRNIQEVACNALEASQVSQNAQQTAIAGNEVVAQTVRSMESIAESVANCAMILEELGRRSEQIGQIVNVIRDIADQTNLLALNAAIEAARAGEQGRGFAVVADEVRKLASRTTVETHQIAKVIGEMQANASSSMAAMREGTGRVEEGRQNASQALSSLDAILQASGNAHRIINQISTSSEEQAAVTTEVTTSMEMINMISQMAESSVNEIAASSRQFLQLAAELEKTSAWFRRE